MVFSRLAEMEALQINNMLRRNTYTIDFVQIAKKNQKAAFDTVLQTAREDKLNVYRYSYDMAGSDHITLYLDLNSRKNEIMRGLHTTAVHRQPDPKSFISGTNAYTLKAIEKVFSEVGYVTNLMVQGRASAVQKLQTALSPYYSQALQPMGLAEDNLMLLLVQVLVTALVFSLVVSLFLVDFYQSYRDLNVKLLQGLTKLSILLQILKDNYLLSILGVGVIMIPLVIVFPNLSIAFILTYLLMIFGMLISFAVTLIVLRNYKISPEILNGRNPQKSVSRVNRLLSVLASIVIALSVLFFGNTVTHLAGQVLGKAQVNKVLSSYSASDLIHINLETQSDPVRQVQQDLKQTTWLKSQLQNQALLYLNNYTAGKNTFGQEKIISSAYLKHFLIYDSDGKRVEVSDNEKSLIELVPIGLKNRAKEIKTQVSQNHQSINFGAYEDATKQKVSTPVDVKIIFIRPSRSPFDLSISNDKTIYRVLTRSNISQYSIYADLFIGSTGDGGLYLKKANPAGDGFRNDPDKILGLSLGKSADQVYSSQINFLVRSLSPFVLAFTVSLTIYLFSLFFGYQQYKKLGHLEIRIKTLLGARKRNLFLPYLVYYFAFAFVLAGIGLILSNDYVFLLAGLLFIIVFLLYIWSNKRERIA
ncbi:MAG: hypothetical protein LBV19_06775 [Streptococcaceae bacterium]|nr:hypothetical protein [Streptococcaceae bacterium]